MMPRASACAAPNAYSARGQVPQTIGQLPADALRRLVLADVDVVAALRLRGRREDRLREPVRLAQAPRQLDAADPSGLLVLAPAGADEVPARHALDRNRRRAPHQHRASLQRLRLGWQGRRVLRRFDGHHVVGHDVAGAREPEGGQLGQHAALVRYRGPEHDVVCRDAVGGHHQQLVADLVHVPDLAPPVHRQAAERSFENGRRRRHWTTSRVGKDTSLAASGPACKREMNPPGGTARAGPRRCRRL